MEDNFHMTRPEGNDPKKLEVHIFDTLSESANNVIMECFFGVPATHERVKGQSFAAFFSRLISKVTHQQFSVPGLILGPKFLDLGLRACDREINQETKLYKSILLEKIKETLER